MTRFIQKLLEYGFYLFLVLLPWQTRWIIKQGMLAGCTWEYGTVSLYAFDIVLILLLIFALFSRIRPRAVAKSFRLALLVFFIAAFLSVVYAKDQQIAWYGVLRLAEGISLVWLITRTPFHKIRIAAALVISASIQSVFAIYQFFSQSSPAFKWLGLSEQAPGILGASVVQTTAGRFLRSQGSLPHPNMLGAFLAIALVILLWAYCNTYANRRLRAVFLGATVLCTAGLLFSFSRSAWLALASSLAIFFLIALWQRRRELLVPAAKYIIVIVITALALIVKVPEPFTTRLVAQERLEQKSTTERIAGLEDSLTLIKKHWLTGVGMGNYTYAVYSELDRDRDPWEYQPVHNLFLLIATELGVFGLAVFLVLLGEILRSILIKAPPRSIWHATLFLAILVIVSLDHFFWTLAFGTLLFWGVLAVFIRQTGDDQPDSGAP